MNEKLSEKLTRDLTINSSYGTLKTNWLHDYKYFCKINNLKQSDIKSLEYFIIVSGGNI